MVLFVCFCFFLLLFSTNSFDELFRRIFSTKFFDKFFQQIFSTNFQLFDEIFVEVFDEFYLLTIASFRIGVPSILFTPIMDHKECLNVNTEIQEIENFRKLKFIQNSKYIYSKLSIQESPFFLS